MKKDKIVQSGPIDIDVTDMLDRNGRHLSQSALEAFKKRLPLSGQVRNPREEPGPWNTPFPRYFKIDLNKATHVVEGLEVSKDSRGQLVYRARIKALNTDFARSMFELVDKGHAEFRARAVGICDLDKFIITNLITFDICKKEK